MERIYNLRTRACLANDNEAIGWAFEFRVKIVLYFSRFERAFPVNGRNNVIILENDWRAFMFTDKPKHDNVRDSRFDKEFCVVGECGLGNISHCLSWKKVLCYFHGTRKRWERSTNISKQKAPSFFRNIPPTVLNENVKINTRSNYVLILKLKHCESTDFIS